MRGTRMQAGAQAFWMALVCGLVVAAAPAGATETAGVDGRWAAVDSYMAAEMRAAHVPAATLAVVEGDRIVYLKPYGSPGPDGRPVSARTPFVLGSLSKSFTALAVMQLVERHV